MPSASHVERNTPYTGSFNLEKIIKKIELSTNNLFRLLNDNHMLANHLLFNRDSNLAVKIGEFDIKSSKEKNLSVEIDTKLYFRKSDFFTLLKSKPKDTCSSKNSELHRSRGT